MGDESPVLDPLDNLLQTTDSNFRGQAQLVLQGMWTQREGRGLLGVTENLLAAVNTEVQRLTKLSQLDALAKEHLQELNDRHRGQPLSAAPLPHHPACGSAPGGSRV